VTPEARAELILKVQAQEREIARLRSLLDEIHRGAATVPPAPPRYDAAGQVPAICEWSIDDCGTWIGTCGVEWVMNEGTSTPPENGMQFCPRCGKPLVALPAKWDEWGDPIVDDDEGAEEKAS